MIAAMCVGAGLFLSGGIADEEKKTATLSEDPKGNFAVRVTNQSEDMSDIDVQVYIDDKLAVSRDSLATAGFHSFHTYRFELPTGKHNLKVVSRKAGIETEKEFVLKGEHSADISFWCSNSRSIPKKFNVVVKQGGLPPTL